ncbi:type IV toxin-antitoxin system AbiEi family antitoxin domain-containing protein [Jiangella sp. DSM 45060]|uniref:type IV toxin-antitoxin system AbiEi family antitoxin domain-containing protein n=1 Tax=Jiangella sp. DSM 45060 TaxID=1798224 RepID=UPI00087C6237|nr:type IV toxin-antitoxin system AbiEi family antitoxin domain-containing protein [Jiangella sp. DSM 45060]SDS12015.1 Transcriptional regulator, AbiEi antitoxin, Type IV TA system [Jiangella sp. DSM 45060]
MDLDDVLARQRGVISRAQALAAGLTAARLRWLVESGRWQRVHAHTFATFTGPLPYEAQVWAAILRVGAGSVASHRTAAHLDGLCDDPGPVVHVTAPVERHVRTKIDGVRVHYAHRLPHTRHPSKNPPRTRLDDTVLDLVDVASHPREAEGWVTAACQRRLTTPERLADALGRRKKIRWRPMTEAMLADVASGAQSPLELRHLRRVERAHGLPTGCRQHRLAGSRVIWIDVDYDDFRLRVELDGRVGHTGEGRFRDRHRDNRATVDGHATLRYGHADVFGDPCGVAAEHVRVLRARGWRGTPRACGPSCRVRPHDHQGRVPVKVSTKVRLGTRKRTATAMMPRKVRSARTRRR